MQGGKGVLFRREELKVDFNRGKKTQNLAFYILHREYGIFRRKFKYQNIQAKKIKFLIFGILGQVWAAHFLTVKQHIFAPFFSSSFTEC